MSFLDLLNGLLTELNVPFYEGAPDFGQDPAPQAFIYYSAHDVPKLRGCGEEMVTTYYVTINILVAGSGQNADDIGHELTTLLINNGFIRMSGNYRFDDSFPKCYHKAIEFNYDYDYEEE